MAQPLTVVDAFTDRPFAGNPAGVLVLDGPREAAWMGAVAAELNLSETAFLWPLPDGRWSLRWFTPATEVALCGHATLASAHVLWEGGHRPHGEPLRFATASGELGAASGDGAIWLDFPALPAQPGPPPTGLDAVLGAAVAHRFVGQTRSAGGHERETNYLVALSDEGAVRALRPDLARLAALPAGGLIATAPADDPTDDLVSRYFAPAVGIPEDPVTGSAHCTLGPYWAERLGKTHLRAVQVSARTGRLAVEVAGDRVRLGGTAVTTIRGSLVAGV